MMFPSSTPVDVRGLVAGYGPSPVLDGVDLTLEQGCRVLLLGPNGAGKTTLFRCLLGLLAPRAGTVRLWGMDPASPDHRIALVRRLGVSLEAPGGNLRIRALEWIRFHATLAGSTDPEATALRTLGMWDLPGDRLLEELSQGERQRLETARCLLHDPEFLILDEPTAHLDPGARDKFWKCLDAWCAPRGTSMIVSTHLLEEAADRMEDWVVVGGGKVLHRGNAATFLETFPSTRRLVLDAPVSTEILERLVAEAVPGTTATSVDPTLTVFRLATPQGRRNLPAIVDALSRNGMGILALGEDATSYREAYSKCIGQPPRQVSSEATTSGSTPVGFRTSVQAAFRLHASGLARERRLLIPFSVMLSLLLAAVLWMPEGPFGASLVALGAVLPGGLCAGLAADLVAGERDRRYLETSLSLPVGFTGLVLGRALAIAFFGLALSWLSIVVLGLASGVWLESAAIAILLSPASLAFCVSLGAWVSVRSRSLRTAAQLSTLSTLPLIALAQGLPLLVAGRLAPWGWGAAFFWPLAAILLFRAFHHLRTRIQAS